MKRRGLLIVVSGPSGVGKGTICKELFKSSDDIHLSVSVTTRAAREGEVHGKNYFFISKEAFQSMIENDELLEYAQVYDNYYGTPKGFVMDQLEQGRDILLEIDIQGALQVKERYQEGVFVFIVPPSMEELRNRIVGRGTETLEAINKRFSSAYDEIDLMSNYDYYIINDTVQNATRRLQCILEAERYRILPENVTELIQELKEEKNNVESTY